MEKETEHILEDFIQLKTNTNKKLKSLYENEENSNAKEEELMRIFVDFTGKDVMFPDRIGSTLANLVRDGPNENAELKWAILAKISALLHSQAIQICISASISLSHSLDYWSNSVLNSRRNVFYYGLQTFPSHLLCAAKSPMGISRLFGFFSSPFSIHLAFKTEARTKRAKCFHLLNKLASFIGLLNQKKLTKADEVVHLARYVSSIVSIVDGCSGFMLRPFGQVHPENDKFDYHGPSHLSKVSSEEMLQEIRVFDKNEILSFESTCEKLVQISASLSDTKYKWQKNFEEVAKPGYFTRNWPRFLGYSAVTILGLKALFANEKPISSFLLDIKVTAHQFFVSWIVEPLKNVWKTIRQEDSLNLTSGTQALASDFDSLQRMVIAYALETRSIGENEIDQLSKAIRSGDLTVVMKGYEDELRSPIKNMIMGDLVRVILIQVQKTKVDLEIAMQALDSMIKSQQLNFAFLAVAPTLIVSGATLRFLWNSIRAKYKTIEKNTALKIKISLRYTLSNSKPNISSDDIHARNMENILIDNYCRDEIPYKANGHLIIEIHVLRAFVDKINDNSKTKEFILSDLKELENKPSIKQKILIVQRMKQSL